MECNKDEALRAKEIAEKRFLANDIRGARKFAFKSVGLYPLEEVQKMIVTLDVYLNAEKKVNGETDWYSVLGLNPQADDETLRQQYRHMALMLHPDKNKSVGAEGAFKHISEAWNMLSDKAKRAAYDQRRKAKMYHAPSSSGPSSSNPGTNGIYNFTKSTVKTSKSRPQPGHTTAPPSHKPKSNTFWTVCHRCKMQYEYLRVYLNHNLLCPNCREAFLAVEVPPPGKSSTRCRWDFSQQSDDRPAKRSATASGRHTNGTYNTSDSYNQTNWAFSGRGSAVHAASVVQQAYEKVKKEREEAQAASRREERKKNAKRMSGASSAGNAVKRRKGVEESGSGGNTATLYRSKKQTSETGGAHGISSKPSSLKDVSQFDMRFVLKHKVRTEISKKVAELDSITRVKSAVNEARNPDEKALKSNEACNQNTSGKFSGEKSEECKMSSVCSINKVSETLKIQDVTVPEADFHDFDDDRTERSFGENQVWALYDGNDGMPRHYALVRNVNSSDPFEVHISWLTLRSIGSLNPLNWVASGFSTTCGDYGVCRSRMIYSPLDSFSHKVRFSKGSDGLIHVYPKKDDVWALYRNWSHDWNELTAYEVIQKYDLVEVLEDYSDEVGVIVIPLIKVARFKTLFHRPLDLGQIRRIPREEIARFSHLIPSRLLVSQEVPGPLKGCIELDPAATPSEFLQVIHDIDEVDLVDEENVNEKAESIHVSKVSDTKTIIADEGESHKDSEDVTIVKETRKRSEDARSDHVIEIPS